MIRFGRHISSLLILFFLCFFSRTEAQTNDNAKIQYYNNLATISFNKFSLEKAEAYCDSALQIHANATTYFLRAYIDNYRRNWEGAIENGSRSIELDSNNLRVYAVLFNAYYNAQKWDDALNIGEKAERGDPSGATSQNIKLALASQQSKNVSKIISWACFLILSIIFFTPLFRRTKKNFNYFISTTYPRLSLMIFVTSCVSCFLYIAFFAVSKWIWSLNPPLSPAEFTPVVRSFIFERDGMESFFLYAFMFIDILISSFITAWLIKLHLTKFHFLFLSAILLIIAGYYFLNIGFSPPLPDIYPPNETQFPIIVVVVGFLSISLFYLYNKSRLLVGLILLLFIGFASLITVYPSSPPDLMYIAAPALRLSHGTKLSGIYFQYDLLPSLLCLFWTKLNLPIDWFPYLGQVSFFLFFIGIFIFVQRYFIHKPLSVFFIIALVTIRYYAVWEAGAALFQTSPLRLDLWLILVWVLYQKGIYHWLTGLCLALLIILHRNLGLLYTASYLALITFLLITDFLILKDNIKNVKQFLPIISKHFRLNIMNLLFVGGSILVCWFIFGDFYSRGAIEYRKYGIGMLPIAKNSFYWYVPILLSSLSVLLYRYRSKLNAKYFSTGIFIILIAISNSMYFFGRSHENNIFNISGVLILSLFVFFDLIIFSNSIQPAKSQVAKKDRRAKTQEMSFNSSNSLKSRICLSLPLLFILLSSFYYANRIAEKLSRQVDNLSHLQFAYPLNVASIDTGAIKQVTNNSTKVYFFDFYEDYYYYYYGHYAPQGYYSPCVTWVFKKDLLNFLQKLLDEHYYIVVNSRKRDFSNEYVPYLNYSSSVKKDNLIALSKQTGPN